MRRTATPRPENGTRAGLVPSTPPHTLSCTAVARGPRSSTTLRCLDACLRLICPNVVMCLLNIFYNWKDDLEQLSCRDQRCSSIFKSWGVNSMAYSLGLGTWCYSRGRLFRLFGRLARRPAGRSAAIK